MKETNQESPEAALSRYGAYFLENITDIIPYIITIVAIPSRDIIYSNRDLIASLGFDVKEIVKMTFADRISLFHPDDLPAIEAFYGRFAFLKDHEENLLEYRLRNKKGEWIFLSIKGKVFKRDESGNVTQVLLAGQDITESKNAEAEILRLKDELARHAEEKYSAVFESIDEGFAVLEVEFNEHGGVADLIFREVNPAFEKHTGLQNVIDRSVFELLPNYETYWVDAFSRVLATGEPLRIENYVKDIYRWYDVHFLRVGGPGTRYVGVVFSDITERRIAQEALRKNAERQAYLLKLSDALRPLSDPIEIQTSVTQIALDHFGADRCYYCEIIDDDAVIRRDASRGNLPSVAGVYPLSSFPLLKVVIDAGKPFVVHDVATTDIIDEPLRQLCIQLQVFSFMNVPVIKQGVPAGVLCITQCIPREWTDFEIELAEETAERAWTAVERVKIEKALRSSEQLLRQLLKQRDEFIGIASHELKTPVTSLKAYGEIVQERLKALGHTQEAELMGRLNAQINRLTLLINDLLDTTKISEGQLKLTIEPVDINELLQERMKEINRAGSHRLVMRTHIVHPVLADHDRIGQVIDNLLSNAIKYSPLGSTIIISSRETAKQVEVSVKDEGRGIPEVDQSKVFERFYRVATDSIGTYPGMGLGLYISAQIIERHGGILEVESHPGIGSVFTFTLPYVLPQV